jgi:hypothetical protein
MHEMHTKFWSENVENLKRRSRRGWEYKVRMCLREIGCEVVEWIDLVQYKNQWQALVNTVMNLSSSLHGVKFLDYLSD